MINYNYRFLPFRFNRLSKKVLLTNDIGEFHFLTESDFQNFIDKKWNIGESQIRNLKSKFFCYKENLPKIINSMAVRFRSKNKFLYDFTSLHMFVVTLRCNQKCDYCHASSVSMDAGSKFDMDRETAKSCVDIAFMSPSKNVKIEFQGGEPLLNFPIVQFIVEYTEELK